MNACFSWRSYCWMLLLVSAAIRYGTQDCLWTTAWLLYPLDMACNALLQHRAGCICAGRLLSTVKLLLLGGIRLNCSFSLCKCCFCPSSCSGWHCRRFTDWLISLPSCSCFGWRRKALTAGFISRPLSWPASCGICLIAPAACHTRPWQWCCCHRWLSSLCLLPTCLCTIHTHVLGCGDGQNTQNV